MTRFTLPVVHPHSHSFDFVNPCFGRDCRLSLKPTDHSAANCDTPASTPISISVDAKNTNNCNQLQDNQHVSNHVCKSQYINGHKSLNASTTFDQASVYTVNTTFSDYYIDTGHGSIKIEYTYTSKDDFQAGFDQLALSVKTK